jgi:hypothetical protein
VDFVVCTLAVKKKIRAVFDMSDRTIPLREGMDKSGPYKWHASLFSQIQKEIRERTELSIDPLLLLRGKWNVMKNMQNKNSSLRAALNFCHWKEGQETWNINTSAAVEEIFFFNIVICRPIVK